MLLIINDACLIYGDRMDTFTLQYIVINYSCLIEGHSLQGISKNVLRINVIIKGGWINFNKERGLNNLYIPLLPFNE